VSFYSSLKPWLLFDKLNAFVFLDRWSFNVLTKMTNYGHPNLSYNKE
jgi:hypothetical protein